MGGARYDEYASWYDERLQGERHPTDCVVCRAILDLDDGRSGVLIDVGCGGAAHRRALCRSGRVVFGFDISFEQVRIRGSVSTPWSWATVAGCPYPMARSMRSTSPSSTPTSPILVP